MFKLNSKIVLNGTLTLFMTSMLTHFYNVMIQKGICHPGIKVVKMFKMF